MFIQTNVMHVDATSRNIYYGVTGEPFRVINIGEATVWVSSVTSSGTDTVNILAAYPIRPGECLENIPGAIATDREYTGFNTSAGVSELRILDSWI